MPQQYIWIASRRLGDARLVLFTLDIMRLPACLPACHRIHPLGRPLSDCLSAVTELTDGLAA